MGVLLNRLLIILNEEDLHSTNYHIAMTLLENYSLMATITIDEIAQLCHVSKSTISKFIRRIGFEDFSEFRDSIPNKKHSDYSYNNNIMNYLESHSFCDYTQIAIKDIQQLPQSLDINKINQLAKDLMQYKKVAAFGLLYSESAAIDLQTKLAYNNKFIFTSMNDIKQNEYISNAKEDTLIIIFSHSGNYLLKHQMVDGNIQKNAFKRTQAKIVVITTNHQIKDYPFIDYCIEYPSCSNISMHSIIYPIISDYIVLRYRFMVSKMETIQ